MPTNANHTTPIQFLNRYSGKIEHEAIYGEKYLRWAYQSPLGSFCRWAFLTRPFFSKWYGWRMNQEKSRDKIAPFIEEYKMDSSEWVKKVHEFQSFNDFFIRQLKPEVRPICTDPSALIFPADARHMAFPDLSKTDQVFIKGQRFNIRALINDNNLSKSYLNGSLLLSRLCPTDYHRFHFCANGQASQARLIPGRLSSVNPIALRDNLGIFWKNKRMLTILETEAFGRILCFEIGATCVGSIIQRFHSQQRVAKGEEKGHFLFGGSSTLLLFEAHRVQFSKDLLEASSQGLELYAHMGDKAGSSCR